MQMAAKGIHGNEDPQKEAYSIAYEVYSTASDIGRNLAALKEEIAPLVILKLMKEIQDNYSLLKAGMADLSGLKEIFSSQEKGLFDAMNKAFLSMEPPNHLNPVKVETLIISINDFIKSLKQQKS